MADGYQYDDRVAAGRGGGGVNAGWNVDVERWLVRDGLSLEDCIKRFFIGIGEEYVMGFELRDLLR